MEGSGDACAVICISGLGVFCRSFSPHAVAEIDLVSGLDLDLERYPRLNRLSTNATSIRLFHLQSIDASEGEQCVPNIVNFLRGQTLSPQKFSTAFRATQSTCHYDRPDQIHYHEGSSSMGLRTLCILRRHETPTNYLVSACIPGSCRVRNAFRRPPY